MTEWGANRLYRVTNVRLDMNPMNATFSSEKGDVTVYEYYLDKYGIKLEQNQPLLEVG